MNILRSKITILYIVFILGLIGCGSSDTSSSNGDLSNVDIEVERGKIYDAKVTDSSTPIKIATTKDGSNIYTFKSTPTYPITVSGGWIDIDGDGKITTNDILSDLNFTSYSNVITPTTTYLGDTSKLIGKIKLENLIAQTGIKKEELFKVPSSSWKYGRSKALLIL